MGWCVVFGEHSGSIFGVEDYDRIDGEKRHIRSHDDSLWPIDGRNRVEIACCGLTIGISGSWSGRWSYRYGNGGRNVIGA